MFPGDPLDNRIVSIRTESEAKLGEAVDTIMRAVLP